MNSAQSNEVSLIPISRDNQTTYDYEEELRGYFAKLSTWAEKEFPSNWREILAQSSYIFGEEVLNTKIFFNDTTNANKLLKLLKNGKSNESKLVDECLDKAKISGISSEEFRRLTCSGQTPLDNEELKLKELTDRITGEMQKRANNFLITSSIQSAFTCIEEFADIIKVWQELQKFANVVAESRKNFPEINKKLENGKKKLDNLEQSLNRALRPDLTQQQKEVVMKLLRERSGNLRQDIRRMRYTIESVKVLANNGIETLGDCKREQNQRAFMNFARASVSAAQLFGTVKYASTYAAAIKASMTAMHLAEGVTNVCNADNCEKKIEELWSVLDEAKRLEKNMDELDESVARVEDMAKQHCGSDLPDDLQDLLNDY